VEKTKGLQPWRRVFHAANGSLIVLALTVLGLPVPTAILILSVVLALSLTLDLLRLLDPKVNVLFFRAFSFLASPREEKKLASSTWYALSALLVLALFSEAYALAGILVLAWADPAANIVGRRWGRIQLMEGTVLGTAAFAVAALLALLFFVPWKPAIFAAVVAALMEASPIDLDDNLIVPITVATTLFLISA
jgi:dolichol kinase